MKKFTFLENMPVFHDFFFVEERPTEIGNFVYSIGNVKAVKKSCSSSISTKRHAAKNFN